MKIRRKTLWALPAVATVVIVIYFLARPVSDPDYQGQRLSVWFDQSYRSRTQDERQKARDAFQAMGEAAIPLLVDRLHAQDSHWKKKYRQFYFTHSSRWPKWIAMRFPVPQPDNAESVRAIAAMSLGLLGEKAKPAVPDLVAALTDESRFVHSSVAQSLQTLGPVAREALPTVVGLLRIPDSVMAENAAGVVVSIARGAPEATWLVSPMLNEEDRFKIRALRVLSGLGDEAISVESEIEPLLASTNASVRFAAVTALWEILPSRHIELLPILEEFAGRTDIELRETRPYMNPLQRGTDLGEAIALRLARMQPLTERGAGLLGSLLHGGSDDLYWRVLTALGKRGSEAPAAVPVVAKLLKHDNPRVAAKAAEVLGQNANDQASVVLLESAMRHPQKMVRDAAEGSLRKIQSKN